MMMTIQRLIGMVVCAAGILAMTAALPGAPVQEREEVVALVHAKAIQIPAVGARDWTDATSGKASVVYYDAPEIVIHDSFDAENGHALWW
jgi:hypothetical protein